MPPKLRSMPQPWPQVSPDQTKRTSRRFSGGVRKWPTTGSLRALPEARSSNVAHEHVAVRRQVGQIKACGHVGDIECVWTAQRHGVRKALIARPFDEHARRLVGAAPDDRAIADHVADLQAP